MKQLMATLLLMIATYSNAQVPDLVLGGPVTIERIPIQILKEPTLSSLSSLREQQNTAGDLALDHALFVLPENDTTPVHITVRTLKLKASQIVTNGRHLIITAEHIIFDNKSSIMSFEVNESNAHQLSSDAVNGLAGKNGRSGGSVDLYVSGQISNQILIDLSGEDGQHGADGNDGSSGKKGRKGSNAKARWGFCKSGQGRGGKGGNGGAGERGGDGGAGGNGGLLTVTFINQPVDPINLRYIVTEGDSGNPGKGGKGGAAGKGGAPGKNTSPCKQIGAILGLPAGHGATGSVGVNGADGQAGAKGEKGTFTSVRLDMPN